MVFLFFGIGAGGSHRGGKAARNVRGPGLAPSVAAQLPYVYVVVDAVALTEHRGLVKRLVRSQKWIVIVPDAVVSELDQLKVSRRARERDHTG